MLKCVIVLLLSGPQRGNPNIAYLLREIWINPHICICSDHPEIRPCVSNKELGFIVKLQELILVTIGALITVEVGLHSLKKHLLSIGVSFLSRCQKHTLQLLVKFYWFDQSYYSIVTNFTTHWTVYFSLALLLGKRCAGNIELYLADFKKGFFC